MTAAFWNESWTAALVNHLWQSTALLGTVWLLALALRKNEAWVRYWLWFAASVKFLLPFSLLIQAGEWLRSLMAHPIVDKPAVTAALQQIAQPFAQAQSFDAGAVAAPAHHAEWMPAVLLAVWACGAIAVVVRFAGEWWRAYFVKQSARPTNLAADVPVLVSPASMEPGIFGIFRPVLLLPQGILERLAAEQLRAILVHEMAHVRRRDNLTFAIHMVVETLFWFHPAVWWIGARLIEERERACDEAVVKLGGEAETYAESILNVCRYYVESPAGWVTGVTGADLKKRIAHIVAGQRWSQLTWSKKLLLGAVAIIPAALPFTLGLAQSAAPADLPRFEVASIKPNKTGSTMARVEFLDDGASIENLTLHMLLRETLGVFNDRLLGEPGWAGSTRYDIEAKVDPADIPRLKQVQFQQRWPMFLPLLEERFGLKYHHETRRLTVYSLVIARDGLKLKEAVPGDTYPNGLKGPDSKGGAGMVLFRRGNLAAQGTPIASLVRQLSLLLGSTVVDKTGLTGRYDFSLHYSPDDQMAGMMAPPGAASPGSAVAPENTGPSLFTALEEQLGLKLEAEKEPVDVVVIDRIEPPSPN